MQVRILLAAPKPLEVNYVPITEANDNLVLDLSTAGIRRLYRGLMMQGFTPQEAGDCIGHLLGLSTVEKSWTVKQILDIEFLKSITTSLH